MFAFSPRRRATLAASSPNVTAESPRTPISSTGAARRLLARLSLGALAFAAACKETPTSNNPNIGEQDVRLALATNIVANPGAVLVAEASFTPAGGARTVLSRDSLVITTGAADTQMSLSADASACVQAASTSGSTCTVTLALTLKRDGRTLDESSQQFPITESTQTVAVPSVQLFEVATVAIDTVGTGTLEPGDTRTLTAVGRDRSGIAVPNRTVTWSVVSGGATVSAAGLVTATTEGAATVRAALGGRTGDLTFTVRQTSVASIDLLPADTTIGISGSFPYRVTPRSSAGTALIGRTVTLSAAPAGIVSIVGNVVTGLTAGSVTVTATSAQGRNGATVTKTATLRVQGVPAIRVDRNAITLDVAPAGTSAINTVVVTTDTGRTIRGLTSAVTYTPNVAPWLTQSLAANVTPTTLTLRAAAGALDTGTYNADVQLTSTLDPHQPATVRVTMRVVRIVADPRTVTFGPYSPNTTTFPPSVVAIRTSMAAVPLSGLTVRTEYIGAGTGWLQTALLATTANPSTSLTLTPNPTGVPAGVNQARVIVSSATPVASVDTILVSLVAGDPGRFSGLVVNAVNQAPVSGATVIIRRLDNTIADQTTTAANGTWTSSQLVANTYNVFVSAPGFQDYVLYSQILVGANTVPVTPLANASLVTVGATTAFVSGSVRDATTNGIVVGATVEVRSGANNTTGTPITTTTTNSDGEYSFQALTRGTYTVRATRTNFTAGSVTVTVIDTQVRAPNTFLSPGGASIAWRFVLTWGATPADLDAHLTGPLANTVQRFHVYWNIPGASTSSPFSRLDVDATDGFGPETITIHQQIAGIYRFYVLNYTLVFDGVQQEMRSSTARVDVYQGNTLVRQFFPPQQNGGYWNVFEINGSVLTPVQTISNIIPSVQLPASGFVRTSLRGDAAMQDLMSFEPWTWVKPKGALKPIKRD